MLQVEVHLSLSEQSLLKKAVEVVDLSRMLLLLNASQHNLQSTKRMKSFWLVPCLLFVFSFIGSNSSIAGEAHYGYDDLGRLITVVDEAGNTAIYNYDAVGNLTGIDRFTPGSSGIDIYTLLPGKGAIGDQVKIQGYGFDTTPSNNTVTFNGTAATVVSATAYAIVATVPSGAATGTVSVTNTNGTANSPNAFTILGAPTISAISPGTVGQNTRPTVSISGINQQAP